MKKFAPLAIVAALAAGNAVAQDSQLGSTSTDRVDLTASVPPVVLINGLPDSFNIGALTPGSGNYTTPAGGLTFCVYSNTGEYYVTATGGAQDDGANGTFALLGAAEGEKIEYTVDIDEAAPFATVAASLTNGLQNGTALTPQEDDPTCAGGDNGSLQLTIDETEINEAFADSYSDQLVLTVEPQ